MSKKSEMCTFIRHNNESKGYQFFITKRRKLIISRDVTCYESSYKNWDEISMKEKIKSTSQGVKCEPISLGEFSSLHQSPPRTKIYSLKSIYDIYDFLICVLKA